MATINTPVPDSLYLTNLAGDPIIGATIGDFTATATALTSGTTAAVTVSELTGGRYKTVFTPTTLDTWSLFVVYDDGVTERVFTYSYEVESATEAQPPAISLIGTPTINRMDLRLEIGSRLGDAVVLTATEDAGDTSSFIDTTSINVAAENLHGRQFICVGGANTGHIARITSTNESNGLITFTPVATTPYAAGDVLHAFNKHSRGWTVAEYNRAIDAAIRDAHPLGLQEVMADITPEFSTDAGEFAVPESITHVYLIESEDMSGGWHRVRAASRVGGYGWSANPGQGTIRISDTPGVYANGSLLRIWGYARHAALTADTDYTTLPPEWLVARACYHLTMSGMDREPTRGSTVLIFRDESTAWRPRIRTIRRSGTVQIR